jgi:hypothetical protein
MFSGPVNVQCRLECFGGMEDCLVMLVAATYHPETQRKDASGELNGDEAVRRGGRLRCEDPRPVRHHQG